jgi:hypothetical protein
VSSHIHFIVSYLLISPIGRFKVDEVLQDKREDCYIATLHINQADIQDARPYYLVVENERGTDRHSISLKVEGIFPGMNKCITNDLCGLSRSFRTL